MNISDIKTQKHWGFPVSVVSGPFYRCVNLIFIIGPRLCVSLVWDSLSCFISDASEVVVLRSEKRTHQRGLAVRVSIRAVEPMAISRRSGEEGNAGTPMAPVETVFSEWDTKEWAVSFQYLHIHGSMLHVPVINIQNTKGPLTLAVPWAFDYIPQPSLVTRLWLDYQLYRQHRHEVHNVEVSNNPRDIKQAFLCWEKCF